MMDLKDLRKQLASLEKDDILKVFGVEERRSAMDVVLPAVGLFGVGLLVGAGIGLLLAPKPGAELRSDITRRFSSMQGDGQQRISGEIQPAAAVGANAGRTA